MKSSCEQICYVAAFASSSYASTVYRTGKPFNPLLGETYECDRRCEMGWRSLTEQVSCVYCSTQASMSIGEESNVCFTNWYDATVSVLRLFRAIC